VVSILPCSTFVVQGSRLWHAAMPDFVIVHIPAAVPQARVCDVRV
jgi:hypothetical protein